MFGLHGFSYALLGKIINIKKIVRFTTRNQLGYRRFSGVLKQKSYSYEKIFSFYTIFGLHCAVINVTPRIIENALYIVSAYTIVWKEIKICNLFKAIHVLFVACNIDIFMVNFFLCTDHFRLVYAAKLYFVFAGVAWSPSEKIAFPYWWLHPIFPPGSYIFIFFWKVMTSIQ